MSCAVEGGVERSQHRTDTDPDGCPVNTSEASTPDVSEAPADVSHLLTTDDVMSPSVGGKCITLCGKVVRMGRSGVIPVEHRPDCECVPLLCLQCVREACEWEVKS